MAKTSATIDLSSMKKAYDDSSKVATNYMDFDDTNGLRISQSGDYTKPYVQIINNGINIVKDSTHKVTIDADSMDIYVGDASIPVAIFGETSQIGQDETSHLRLDAHSLQLISKELDTYFHVADLRGVYIDGVYRDDVAKVKETFISDGTTTLFNTLYQVANTSFDYFTVTADPDDGTLEVERVGNTYFEIGTALAKDTIIAAEYYTKSTDTKAMTFGSRASSGSTPGPISVAEGLNNIANGRCSHAQGENSKAIGNMSHSEGVNSSAEGIGSHAEGYGTIASGYYSHAEGRGSKARAIYSHAEGDRTVASGYAAHASGTVTRALAQNSFTAGEGTEANSRNQTVIGEYNRPDPAAAGDTNHGNYAFIIGNGDEITRSNALTVDWNGNVWHQGDGLYDISSYITVTTGTLNKAEAIRYGKVVQLMITAQNSSSVASGANIFAGTLNTSSGWIPYRYVTGGSYYGAHAIIGSLGTGGALTMRNASSTAVTISGSNTATVSLTYILP